VGTRETLAKLARQKGQYFFDPQNITIFLVKKITLKLEKSE
jgi:hypothetical protein